MNKLPSGTVTFLFTDIEGSTKLAQGHPDEWESLRERHHAILHSAMDAHNGYVFQIIGDAFCVAFHTASDAINAAADAQRKLQTGDWGETPIKVRMGIHTGEAESQANGEYRGYLAMSRVQRLMSAGHGRQVLISQATQELIRDKLPKEVTLRDMGEHKLKDVPLPVRIFQVVVPDLQKDFPILRTLSVFPNNLPTQITSFVGREKELADVKRLLQDTHMLTLIGPGGTGKTRLSVQAASESLEQYHDGVWLVELAPILDHLLVPRTTAIAIGLREEPQLPVIDMLRDYLREKRMLILLDNCEHLVDACAQMANKILQAAPNVRILASSREALGIAGEVTYRVPSLGLPDMNHLPSVESLSQYEAVKLFIDRATSAIPSFSVTNDNAPSLAQICHRLDGIPLAIELAAAKIRVLNVEQIAKRLDDRFRLLTGGSRTALEHHQTLRAAIDWSYNLLLPNEQILFSRLSVFVGGWTLEAAEAVCSDDSIKGDDVLDLVEHLINKSIVITEEMQHETRYHMLETIRQYAHEKLIESSESQLIRSHHFDFFLVFAESAAPRLRSADSLLWLKRFELENNNLRAALQWSLDAKVELGLHLAGVLFWFWYIRGHWREGHKWAKDVLTHNGAQARPAFRAQALFVLGGMNWNLSNYSAAREALVESFKLSQSVNEKWWMAFALLWLGWTNNYTSNFDAARSCFEEALTLAREVKDDWLTADLLRSLGSIMRQWDVSAALLLLDESLTLARKVGDPWLLAWELISAGGVAVIQGKHEQAAIFYEESATWCRKIQDKGALAAALGGLGTVLLIQENIAKATAVLLESLVLAVDLGSYQDIGTNLVELGGVAAAQGKATRAVHLMAAGEAILKAHNLSLSVWPNETAAYNRYIASIHSQIDDITFNTAWTEGSKMTMNEAIKLATEV